MMAITPSLKTSSRFFAWIKNINQMVIVASLFRARQQGARSVQTTQGESDDG